MLPLVCLQPASSLYFHLRCVQVRPYLIAAGPVLERRSGRRGHLQHSCLSYGSGCHSLSALQNPQRRIVHRLWGAHLYLMLFKTIACGNRPRIYSTCSADAALPLETKPRSWASADRSQMLSAGPYTTLPGKDQAARNKISRLPPAFSWCSGTYCISLACLDAGLYGNRTGRLAHYGR